MTINDQSVESLLRKAVRIARPARRKTIRWAVVVDAFAVGSTTARALCRFAEVDHDETLPAVRR